MRDGGKRLRTDLKFSSRNDDQQTSLAMAIAMDNGLLTFSIVTPLTHAAIVYICSCFDQIWRQSLFTTVPPAIRNALSDHHTQRAPSPCLHQHAHRHRDGHQFTMAAVYYSASVAACHG